MSEALTGFRPKISTKHAVADFTEIVSRALNSSLQGVAVYIDLEKAFDSVPNDILLAKLENAGIRGTARNWLATYLSDRTQVVDYNSVISPKVPISYGVV